MSNVDAVRALRDFSGESIWCCQQALEYCAGDLIKAAGWLAIQGQLVYRPNDTFDLRLARAEAYAKGLYTVVDGRLERVTP